MFLSKSKMISAIGLVGLGLLVNPALSDNSAPHDSNTLHKIGNSVQYVFRKGGQNISKDVHKTVNRDNINKAGSAIQYPIQKAGQNISVDTHNVEGKKSTLHQTNGTDKVIPPLPHNKRKHLFQ
jgi:hypothetical protein